MNLVAKVEFIKMSTPQEQAQCVSWFIETKSDIQVQWNFRCKYGRKPFAQPTIQAWHKNFIETGSGLQRKGTGQPQISGEEIESVQAAYTRSPRNSYKSHTPLFTKFCIETCDFMHIKYSYCKPLSQKISHNEKNLQWQCWNWLDSDPRFLKHVCFSDKSTFHISGLLNRYNLRIWGLENPHDTCELERDSPKLNVWCGIMHNKVIGLFFFRWEMNYSSNLPQHFDRICVTTAWTVSTTIYFPAGWCTISLGLKFINFWMKHFQIGGLDMMVPFFGCHVPLMLHCWVFSCGAM